MRLPAGVLIALLVILLPACGGKDNVRPETRRPAPISPGDNEPRSKYGNPETYEVYGKTYTVLPTARDYSERGQASWYGEEFHGKRTSSGEPYNMNAMTAAHRTLPLPSYVRVTNLQNRREIIVRVNDRGPFHDDRIIDLSFAAATELGLVRNGTAEVEVVAVDPVMAAAGAGQPQKSAAAVRPPLAEPVTPPPSLAEDASLVLAPDEIPVSAQRRTAPTDTAPVIRELSDDSTPPSRAPSSRPLNTTLPTSVYGHYLQTGAYSNPNNATVQAERLRKAGFETVGVYPTEGILKVRLGPYSTEESAEPDRQRLSRMGIRAYLVQE